MRAKRKLVHLPSVGGLLHMVLLGGDFRLFIKSQCTNHPVDLQCFAAAPLKS